MFQQALTARLLVIDDDAVLRAGIQEYFEDNGFTVIEAEEGQQGLLMCRSKKPDLVVIDLQIQGLSGIEILRTITQEFPELPIVVISETNGLEAVIQALRIGAWDYLSKPLHALSVLEHALCRALERARLIQENRLYRQQLETANQALQKNLQILQADQEAGRSVQRRLLPDSERTFGHYHFAYHVAPSLYLSGDFVDYFEINSDQLGFYIADVSGHGASSAFVTVLLRSLLLQLLGRYQTEAHPLILKPTDLLNHLSQEIYDAKLGKYLTMIYGVIDCKKNQLSYSVAGHYPTPILLKGDQASFLSGSGFPAGIIQKTNYTAYQQTLKPGMKLLFCSDGILEIVEGADLEAKEKQLLSLALQTGAAIPALVNHFNLNERLNLPDDVTLLSIAYAGVV